MKRQRHIHFIDMQSLCTIIRDKEGYTGDTPSHQLKLISVRNFSYATWKLMEDVCTEKNINIDQLSKEQIVATSFAVLPDSQGNRIRAVLAQQKDQKLIDMINQKLKQAPPSSPTLLHKLTMKRPEEIKPLISRMRAEWPTLVMPHIYNL